MYIYIQYTYIGPVPLNMQTYMKYGNFSEIKYALCADANGNSIFQFLNFLFF